jgi:uncharacterized 2Fe-2S/4Fe-4S cluster protein (DUF4445 family)
MTQMVTVTFVDSDGSKLREIEVPAGQSVLQVALDVGLKVTATCGRRGQCRGCRVKALAGEISPPSVQDTIQLGQDAVRERFRLSCQMSAVADCSIMLAPPHSEVGHQVLTTSGSIELVNGLDPGVRKHFIRAQAPQDENHQTSDLEEILKLIESKVSPDVSLDVLRQLPGALRAESGRVTLTTFNEQLIHIEAGDTEAHMYGMAFDIGTTSVVGSLIDLRTGEQLASVSGINPQAAYGGDLMSRIAYAQFDEKKLQTLRAKIIQTIADFAEKAATEAGISLTHVYKITVVGNTCMHHIVLGIDTSYVGLAPYAPSVREPIVVSTSDLSLRRIPNARVCFLPIVAGFVGADTIAAILATKIYESDTIRLLVDIGTNGEVVLGSKHGLMACSAPAGPAFEGGQIKHGMRGAVGAIERVEISDDVICEVIGNVKSIGICGSGLIDCIAKMLEAGVIDGAGRLARNDLRHLTHALKERFVAGQGGRAFVLTPADQSGNGEDIVLTQGDIRQLQLAKAAIFGGILMLQRLMKVPNESISEVLLSGGFGNYVNLANAVKIRLLPDVPLDRITYVGNAALLGAQLALLSETERKRSLDIVSKIQHVALATRSEFQDIFVEACSLSNSASATTTRTPQLAIS